MFRDTDENFDPTDSGIVRLATRYIRITKTYEGDKFFVKKDGRRTGTMLFLVLIVVEFTDLIFAVDSIPAIFGITTDRFIIYTSNVFAILGLRTFFFLLADIADRFHYLKSGLAFILTFIGVKMLLPLAAEIFLMAVGGESMLTMAQYARNLLAQEYKDELTTISLTVVVSAITLSVVASLIFPTKRSEMEADEPGD
jgi:tellurite resistance protein TerC